MKRRNQELSVEPWPSNSSIEERQAVMRFRDEVCAQMDIIDPSGEQDWYSLSLGFFLALKIPVERAHELAIWVRYEKYYFKE